MHQPVKQGEKGHYSTESLDDQQYGRKDISDDFIIINNLHI